MRDKLVITTGCCEKSIKHKAVRLSFDFDYETFTSYEDMKPIWTSRGFDEYKYGYIDEKYVEVKYCPFCGVDLPEIERNESGSNPIHNGDFDYCDTCGERNRCCNCLPPEFKWKPVGYDVEIPIILIEVDE